MRLSEAFGVQKGDLIAFTGAGGKTNTMFALGMELARLGWRVLATTTAPTIPAAVINALPGKLTLGDSARPAAVTRALDRAANQPFVFLSAGQDGDRLRGLTPDVIDQLADAVDSDVMLVKADFAHSFAFKAPYPAEPWLPAGTSLAIPMVSLEALGQPFDAEHVYNPNTIVEEFGYAYGERIKAPWIASVMRHAELGLKGIAPHTRIAALINDVPYQGYPRGRARLIAQLMLRSPRIERVALGSAPLRDPIHEVQRRVAAIVVAGGLSSRMGDLKVLLPWDNRPVLTTIVQRLHTARLDNVLVVTGYRAGQVDRVAAQAGARTAFNADYESGEMLSSLQTGLRALGSEVAACLLVLGDQPQIELRVVNDLLTAYAEQHALIVVPHYQRRRGHPILIDRALWPELLALPPGSSPRDVLRAHDAETIYVESATDSILRDIDTPEDYARERKMAGLN